MVNLEDNLFAKEWVKEMVEKIKTTRPNLSERKIRSFVMKKLENIKVSDVTLYNSHRKESRRSNLLKVTNGILKTNPILTVSGVMYKRHEQEQDPANLMSMRWIKSRKVFKDEKYKWMVEVKKFEDELNDLKTKNTLSRERYNEINDKLLDAMKNFKNADIDQLLEKIKVNSFYGVSGLKTSVFYNLHAAVSTTLTGQYLISIANTTFENFMENNVPFQSMDECYTFINNVSNEKNRYYDHEVLDRNFTIKEVFDKLKGTFEEESICNDERLSKTLNTLPQNLLNRLYTKNNIFEFMKNSKVVKKILKNVLGSVDSFLNPNKVPDKMKAQLDMFYDYIKDYVEYCHSVDNIIYRTKFMPRKSVVTIDTDSNMINLCNWLMFVIDDVLNIYDEYEKFVDIYTQVQDIEYYREQEDLDFEYDEDSYKVMKDYINEHEKPIENRVFKIITVMCNILTRVIQSNLKRYAISNNIVAEELYSLINMKNEYIYEVFMTTISKKNYAARNRVQEGKIVPEAKQVDIKGLQLMKSVVSKETSQRLIYILQKYVLERKVINRTIILRELQKFEKEIHHSLEVKHETKYLKRSSVKALDAYKHDTVFSQQQVKATLVWNELHPKQNIPFPSDIYILKTKINSLDVIKDMSDREVFENIKNNIFNSEDENIRKAGLTALAIPLEYHIIPEWLIPYIDYNACIADCISKFDKILLSLDLNLIHEDASNTHYSNIVTF